MKWEVISGNFSMLQPTIQPMHYAPRAMGAVTSSILELCLSFSPHPNISDGNFNLEEEGESERKVINQIFGRLLHPKNEVRYLENIFFRLKKRFLPIRGCFS